MEASPLRRWDRLAGRGASPSGAAAAATAAVAFDPAEEADSATVRQLRQNVGDLDGRMRALVQHVDKFRETAERRLEHLAVSIGEPSDGGSPLLLRSRQNSEVSGFFSTHDRFMSDLSAGSPDSKASVSDRLALIEQVIGEAAERPGSPRKSPLGLAAAAAPSSLRKRMEYLERLLGDSAEKHSKAIADARVACSNKLLQKSPARMPTNLHATAVCERLDFVENVVGDSMEKHTRELAAAHVKLDLFAVRVVNCEASRDQVLELKTAHDVLSQEHAEKHASFKQRLDFLEKLIGDSADKHARELDKIRRIHTDAAATHQRLVFDCQEKVSDIKKSLDATLERHARDLERVSSDHKRLATDVVTQGKGASSMRSRVESLSSDAGVLNLNHASIGERVQDLERKVKELLNARVG